MILRELRIFSELVCTTIPGSTGRTQEAGGTRALSTSTTHKRQTPTGVSFCRWQSVGIVMPFMRAASNTLVFSGTRTALPSMVRSTILGGVVVVLTSSPQNNEKQKTRCSG